MEGFAVGLIAAAVVLVQAALSPKAAHPVWVLLCSIYTSVGTVTAIRQAYHTTLLLPEDVMVVADLPPVPGAGAATGAVRRIRKPLLIPKP